MSDINEKLDKMEKDLKKMSEAFSRPSPRTRDSVKEMRDAGFGLFTAEGKKTLNMINNRYTSNFLAFFVELEKKYTGSGGQTAETAKIKEVRQRIGDLSVFIDQLLAGAISSDPIKDIQKLRQSISDLDAYFEFFMDASKTQNMLSESMKAVANSTGVSVEDLKYAQGLFGRKVEQISTPSRFPELKDYGKDILKGIGLSAISPFIPFVSPISRALRGGRERKETLENFAFQSASVNRGPEASLPSGAPTPSSPVASVEEEQAGGRPRATTAGSSRTFGGESLQDALFSFFNARAFQAKWTKDLMDLASGKTVSEEKEPGKGMDLSGMMGNMVKTALPALGILASAAGGWMAGRWLGENIKWGGKSLDQHVQTGILAVTGQDEKSQLKKQAAQAQRPEMKRALELQAQGMSIKDSVAQATAEAGIGGGGETSGGKLSPTDLMGKYQSIETEYAKQVTKYHKTGKKEDLERQRELRAQAGEIETQLGESISEANKTGVGKAEYEKLMKSPEYKEAEKERMLAIKEAQAAQKIPIDTTQADLQKDSKAGIDKLNASVDEMTKAVKESGKGGKQAKPSGYDANNTRNPILSSIGAGQITD